MYQLNCTTYLHTFSAFWLWSSVVSVLISVTTDMLPTGSFSCHINFSWGTVFFGLARDLFACRLCIALSRSVANPVWVNHKQFNAIFAKHCLSPLCQYRFRAVPNNLSPWMACAMVVCIIAPPSFSRSRLGFVLNLSKGLKNITGRKKIVFVSSLRKGQ